MGLKVTDWQGDELGIVIDTWPFDGGGEPELAVLRLGRLGGRRMVPVAGLLRVGHTARAPYERWQIEDSPRYGEDWHSVDDDPWRALSYWRWEEPVVSLTGRWQPNSGSFATAKPFHTTPSPTTIAS